MKGSGPRKWEIQGTEWALRECFIDHEVKMAFLLSELLRSNWMPVKAISVNNPAIRFSLSLLSFPLPLVERLRTSRLEIRVALPYLLTLKTLTNF